MDTQPKEKIEARAYEIYLERGREHGHDLEDWLAAEKELSHRRNETEAIFAQEEPREAAPAYAARSAGRKQ